MPVEDEGFARRHTLQMLGDHLLQPLDLFFVGGLQADLQPILVHLEQTMPQAELDLALVLVVAHRKLVAPVFAQACDQSLRIFRGDPSS